MDKALYPRFSATLLEEIRSDTPVVVIQGARQVGKSTLTLMASEAMSTSFVTLDDPATLEYAVVDPVRFLQQGQGKTLVIDEIQRAPSLILPLKAEVDRDRKPGRFILTGSADLLTTPGVGDSLAGRAETLHLQPLSQGEILRRISPENFVSTILNRPDSLQKFALPALTADVVTTGGYPLVLHRAPRRQAAWFNSYIERLATHDAAEIADGKYAAHFTRLIKVIAAGGLSELVQVKAARALEISPTTLSAYLDLMARMHLLVEIPSWGRSLHSRAVRRPKVALCDTGLSSSLAGFAPADANQVGGREYFGPLVEQFVALELLKQRTWSEMPFDLFHYRDRDGLEVDLVAETQDGRLVAMEVKTSMTPTKQHWTNLERFRERFKDRQVTGVLLHGGTHTAAMNGWLHILPIPSLWSEPIG